MAALPRVGAGRNVVLVTGAGLLTMGAVASGFRAANQATATEARLAALAVAMNADAVDALSKMRWHVACSKLWNCLKRKTEVDAGFNTDIPSLVSPCRSLMYVLVVDNIELFAT